MHFLCKAHDVLYVHFSAVIEYCPAAHLSEHLMLVGDDQLVVEAGRSVEHRLEAHLKASVRGRECPRIHVTAIRDVERDVIELVGPAVPEEDVFGRSAHIGKAKEGLDSLAAAVQLYTRAMEMEQRLPTDVFRLLKFGRMESGTVRNALSAHTRLEGSLRAFQDEVFESLRDGLTAIGRDVQQETGCNVQVQFAEGYRAVINPPELYHKVAELMDLGELEAPSMTSEDFSFYQRRVPGLFMFLGVGNTPALHSDTFDFDEEILLKGADFFVELAEKFQ